MNEPVYRPISRFSVVAILAGLLSLLALMFPAMIMVPATGALLALVAKRQVHAANGELAGGRLAGVGLFLCVFCLTATLGYGLLHRSLLLRNARDHADTWLEIVAKGDFEKAHQLTLVEEDREAEGTDLKHHYRPLTDDEMPSPTDNPEEFPPANVNLYFNTSPLKEVTVALRGGDAVEFVRVNEVTRDGLDQIVEIVFRPREL